MKKIQLFSLLLVGLSSYAQNTLIPDRNFEKALIRLGIDSGTPDGKVLTSRIRTLTTLNVSNQDIANLTGIGDFAALKSLDCSNNLLKSINISKNVKLTKLLMSVNNLTGIDLSKNTALLYLDLSYNNGFDNSSFNGIRNLNVSRNINLIELNCSANSIASLDVSKNLKLISLRCAENKLKSLDVSKLLVLSDLDCSINSITSLDISQNKNLSGLSCIYNKLTSLNLKNGNNGTVLGNSQGFGNIIHLDGNFNLRCIQVDNVDYANQNWSDFKDDSASFSTNCSSSSLAIETTISDTVKLYPNPTPGIIHIDNVIVENIDIYDASGYKIKTIPTNLFGKSTSSTIDLSDLPKAVYYLYIASNGTTAVKKIITE